MPELPEVETVARQLSPLLTGRTKRSLAVFDPLLRRGPTPRLTGRRIEAVRRIGKQVLIEFDSGRPRYLAVHLRMTGRLLFSERADPDSSHLRARFTFDRGALEFRDTRRFGTFTFADELAPLEPVGAEPLAPEFTIERLHELLRASPTPLKIWLLRQDRIVGIGNIYASEILWESRLSPQRAAGRLTRAEIERLHAATLAVLSRAIDNSGTTFSDFQDAYGVTGSYQSLLKVYEREGKPCLRCATPIRRATQAQRSSYWCPACIRR